MEPYRAPRGSGFRVAMHLVVFLPMGFLLPLHLFAACYIQRRTRAL